MFDGARHGESVSRFAGGLPIRTILYRIASGCVLLAAWSWLPANAATSMYHCIGASGETVYSSSPVGYRGCRKIGSYAEPAPRKPPAKPPSISLTRVAGAVATTARNLAADGVQPTSLAKVQGEVATA
ncbi:MAG: DUF4124 domain-containing protein, partial [Stenotrophomonas sp.]